MKKSILFLSMLIFINGYSQQNIKAYYIQKGNELVKVQNDPQKAYPDYWGIKLYKKGQSNGGNQNWGMITSKNLSELYKDLEHAQFIEKKYSNNSVFTYFNTLGPVAYFYNNKKDTTKKNKENVELENKFLQTYSELKSDYETLKDISDLESNEVIESRDRKFGETLKEFGEQLYKNVVKASQFFKDFENFSEKNINELKNQLRLFQEDIKRNNENEKNLKSFAVNTKSSTGSGKVFKHVYKPPFANSGGSSYIANGEITYEVNSTQFYFKLSKKIYSSQDGSSSTNTSTEETFAPMTSIDRITQPYKDNNVDYDKPYFWVTVFFKPNSPVKRKIITTLGDSPQEYSSSSSTPFVYLIFDNIQDANAAVKNIYKFKK